MNLTKKVFDPCFALPLTTRDHSSDRTPNNCETRASKGSLYSTPCRQGKPRRACCSRCWRSLRVAAPRSRRTFGTGQPPAAAAQLHLSGLCNPHLPLSRHKLLSTLSPSCMHSRQQTEHKTKGVLINGLCAASTNKEQLPHQLSNLCHLYRCPEDMYLFKGEGSGTFDSEPFLLHTFCHSVVWECHLV